jgi:hypothetical protein
VAELAGDEVTSRVSWSALSCVTLSKHSCAPRDCAVPGLLSEPSRPPHMPLFTFVRTSCLGRNNRGRTHTVFSTIAYCYQTGCERRAHTDCTFRDVSLKPKYTLWTTPGAKTLSYQLQQIHPSTGYSNTPYSCVYEKGRQTVQHSVGFIGTGRADCENSVLIV